MTFGKYYRYSLNRYEVLNYNRTIWRCLHILTARHNAEIRYENEYTNNKFITDVMMTTWM